MDATEFRHIVLPLYEPMYRIAFSVIGNSDDAQDAVQDAVAKLWANRQRLTAVKSHEAFCITAARNAAIDILNTRSRREAPATIDELNRASSSCETEDMTAAVEAKEALERIDKLMDQLDPLHREILLLRSHADLPIAEIAEMKGITHENARAILSRARKRLKELYNRIK
ncbi:MAG: RNA polymerase sigma factor [Bacteroides sp.]|nr:RNA polymerase sigma factor [Bacteroides sp.]MBD5285381.1 RNA polymerase sigma factor [Bacteroides sp.]